MAIAAEKKRPEKRDLLGPDVGRRIKEVRTKRGMSLGQVGGQDLSRSFLSVVESGRSRISLRALAIVAERLDTPISEFLEDQDIHKVAELTLDLAQIDLERNEASECLKRLAQVPMPPKWQPRALWLTGRAFMAQGKVPQAIETLRRGLDLQDDRDGDQRLRVETLCSLAGSLYAAHRYDEGLEYYRQGLAAARREDPEDPIVIARLTLGLGNIHYVHQEIEQAMADYEQAQELFGVMYDMGNRGRVYSAMSLASSRRGDLDAAIHYAKLSLGMFQFQQDWRLVAGELNNLAVRYREIGELDSALAKAQEAVKQSQDAQAQDMEAIARGTLASIHLQRDELGAAEAEAAAAESLASSDLDLARIDAWVVQAQMADRRNDTAKSDQLYTRALDGLRELDNRGRLAEVALRYANVLNERGESKAGFALAVEAAQVTASRASA